MEQLQRLKKAVNNKQYSDIEILCKDEKILYGSRVMLAVRCEVFDRLLYNGMKETFDNKITFPEFVSSAMLIVLEYLYTGSITMNQLNKDNLLDVYIAADFFLLKDLQQIILQFLPKVSEFEIKHNYIPELFTEMISKFPTSALDENPLTELLLQSLLKIPLSSIEYGRLSLNAFKYLLKKTLKESEKYTLKKHEYLIFRYAVLLSAHNVSKEAFSYFQKNLKGQIKINEISSYEISDFNIHAKKVSEMLEPLLEFIELWKIDVKILTMIIRPLNIVSTSKLTNVYENLLIKLSRTIEMPPIRGYKFSYRWNSRINNFPNITFGDHGKKKSSKSYKSTLTVITLRLNMFNHTLGYSKNGSEIDFQWTQLSDKLFPVVSSKYAYNTRICSHDKP